MAQSPQQRLDALLARLEPAVRQAFLEMIRRKAATINLNELANEIEAAMRTGDTSRVVAMLQLNQVQQFPLTEAIRAAFIAGGQSVGDGLPLVLRANFGFGMNSAAAAQVNRLADKITGEISQGAIETTRALVAQAVNEGIPARTLAYQIVGVKNAAGVREGGYLGLDGPRAEQAAKVAAMLRDPERIKDYFIRDRETGELKPRYTVTDRRFDRMVAKAIREGLALSGTDADKITTLHRARLLKNRGDTIARQETTVALRAGEHAGWRQLVDSGVIAESRIERTWLARIDSHTRDDHVTMNGQKVTGLSQPFVFPGGSMAMFPGDGSLGAPAEELINCRCNAVTRLKRPAR